MLPEWGPARISKTEGGFQVELVRCTSVFDSRGAFCPTYDPDDVKVVEADAVIMAVGQGIDLSGLGENLADRRGRITVDAFTQASSEPGLYAGGDAVTGPATVIGAVASGSRAAAAMAEKLGRPLPEKEAAPVGASLSFAPKALEPGPALAEPMIPAAERGPDREDAATVSQAEAPGRSRPLPELRLRCLEPGRPAPGPGRLRGFDPDRPAHPAGRGFFPGRAARLHGSGTGRDRDRPSVAPARARLVLEF